MLRQFLERSFARAGSLIKSGQEASGHIVRLEEPAELLRPAHRQQMLHQVAAIAALPPEHHRSLVLDVLERYASFVQRLPASEAHHHAGLGGMLDHGLEVTLQALLIRRGKLLPVGAEPEQIGKVHDLWTYAVFTAAVLHDIGKPAVDQEVMLLDAEGQRIGPWDPWSGPMARTPCCHGYAVCYRRGRRHRFHERAAPLLVHHIVPERGLAWLASDQELFATWLASISGDMEAAGSLGEIIQQADGLSVARNLGAGDAVRAVPGRAKPLWERLLTGLRYLVLEGELPLNRNGAAGWLVGDDLWLVSKRAIDALRAHLGTEGHTGIPSKNERIYDTLQEHGVLEACGDRAIWRATVAAEGWAHDLTVIRIRVQRIWPQVEDRPDPFEGTVTPLLDPERPGSLDTQTSGQPITVPAGATSVALREGGSATIGGSTPMESDPDDAFAGLPMPTFTQEKATPAPIMATPAESGPGSETGGHSGNTPRPAAGDLVEGASLDAGRRFLAWLQSELAHQRLAVNSVQARIHVVTEGVLLISPAIFRDFADRVPDEGTWEHVQKRFLKLKLHVKRPDGTNVHRYRVTGERRQSVIKGIVLPDAERVFGSAPRPAPNPHLKAADG
jgi:integrating conjugative element relaxase (TIGR03760 family)